MPQPQQSGGTGLLVESHFGNTAAATHSQRPLWASLI